MHYLLAAIIFLAPHLGRTVARTYARIIRTEAARKDIDPLLVVSFIHHETYKKWRTRIKSPTNDYGLTQVHVAARGSATFLGREEELYDPKTNIREWCRLAHMWRAYHQRACVGAKHHWWAHMKWGYKIKPTKEHPGESVAEIYERLK